jgi:5-amino-6-(5-phosphoribosylamino)uracil reductase/diaminohydroxyphosphoribosylaminopyrimidine deaminase/5-amino-6-(5-phosphoribosylamino)uracil reductase
MTQPIRPRVTICYTQTLDGRLATVTGHSQWIGGPESVRLWHQLRAQHDAVMVGVGTVLADNPRLTVRHVAGCAPLRVVVDSTLRTPLDAAVLAGSAAARTILAVTGRAPAERCAAARSLGATVLELPAGETGQIDLAALLAALNERGIGALMVEGGAALITALLRARLADRMVVCVAPSILGAGVEAIGDLGIRDLAHLIRLAGVQVHQEGWDLIVDGSVVYPLEY